MRFTKMHGTGNDFIVIDCIEQKITERAELANAMCQRRFAVGADQFILICPSKKADYLMEIYNPDGSQVEMCGNALRAVALYVRNRRQDSREVLNIETLGGLTKAVIKDDMVTVNMGAPSFLPNAVGLTCEEELINESYSFSARFTEEITCVSIGNPHCIMFVEDTENCEFDAKGPLIENHEIFKNRTNVEFIKIINRNEVDMRVWERGAGETLACGSGACASVAACIRNGFTDRSVKVNLKGGQLQIEWNEDDNCIYMTGPACFVFDGIWSV
ncbi:MAG: diaminopimelate epimerase [Lentisphaeraceae bacterium]|nr:diaminopimelate epimerase [Lentisphaeraceae bacterium]